MQCFLSMSSPITVEGFFSYLHFKKDHFVYLRYGPSSYTINISWNMHGIPNYSLLFYFSLYVETYIDKKREREIDIKANTTFLEIRLCKGYKKTSTSSILGLFCKGVGWWAVGSRAEELITENGSLYLQR